MMLRLLLLLLFVPRLAIAQPELILPIDCTLGENCFIQQFVDRDPGAGAQDYMCGNLVYDGHKGTDFALHSLKDLTEGVNVLAAAAGVVKAVRNDMPDILYSADNASDLQGRDCGNGLVMDHGDGWETQYCHLEMGSVSVAPQDQIEAGTILGRVGLSGRTQFPHLHISLRKNGEVIDPYELNGDPSCGADPAQSLWQIPHPTPQGGIITTGFFNAVPDYDAVKEGTAHTEALSDDTPALVVWAYMFGSQVGDEVEMTIRDPSGETFYQDTVVLDRIQAQLFRAGGRRAPKNGWLQGNYNGSIQMKRGDLVIDRQTVDVTIGTP